MSSASAGRAGVRPIVVLLAAMIAVGIAAIAVVLLQAAGNTGPPEARITVLESPLAVSFAASSAQGLRQDWDTAWKKAWSDAGHSDPAQRGIVPAYVAEPEVHSCGGVRSRVVVRGDLVGLLEDLESVAGFEVGPRKHCGLTAVTQ